MGQAPTRPLQLDESALMHTPPLEELLQYSRMLEAASTIDHLPDLSPFPRQTRPPAAQRPGTRPPSYRSSRSYKAHQRQSAAAATALATAGYASEGRRSRDGRAREGKAVRAKSRARRPQMSDRQKSKRSKPAISRGVRQETNAHTAAAAIFPTAAATPTSAIGIIPRIDIVESSPLLTGTGSPNLLVSSAPGAHHMPSFSRSPSMPAVLPDIIPEYLVTTSPSSSTFRPGLSRPVTAPSPTGTGITPSSNDSGYTPLLLPLPGTPFTEEVPLIDFADFDGLGEQEGVTWRCKVEVEGRHDADMMTMEDQDSVVTQEIRILRVMNPDCPETPTSSRAPSPIPVHAEGSKHAAQPQQQQKMAFASSPAISTGVTLAEKRHVCNPPAPIRIAHPPIQDASRLSPTTPVSGSSSSSPSSGTPQSGLFSKDGSSISSPVTSLPPSPSVKAGGKKSITGLGVSSLAVPSTLIADGRGGMKVRAASTPISPVTAVGASSATKKSSGGRRRVSAEAAGRSKDGAAAAATTIASRARKQRSRSQSFISNQSSDDGDRSGTCSSAAGVSPAAFRFPKARAFSAGSKPARKTKQKTLDRADDPSGGIEERSPQLVQVPTLKPALAREALHASCGAISLAPPRSPRPPTTPRLCNVDQRSSDNEEAEAFPTSSAVPQQSPSVDNLFEGSKAASELPYAPLPPASPLKMDWFTTDLLVRCGIQPSSLTVLPVAPTRPATPLLPSSGTRDHPSALQPRKASSPLPLPSPLTANGERDSEEGGPVRGSARRSSGLLALPGTPLGLGGLLQEKSDPFDTATAVLNPEAITPSIKADKAPDNLLRRSESIYARRERKKREKAARYAAFAELAQMAVESPQGNPFVGADGQGGAVRLGEYKRGFNGREIVRWARAVYRAEEIEAMDGDGRKG